VIALAGGAPDATLANRPDAATAVEALSTSRRDNVGFLIFVSSNTVLRIMLFLSRSVVRRL
jgi:hypothetical protein